jgi:small GTP-binding protein
MQEGKSPRLKICLVGESEVGKTCLIRRYVLDQYDDKYISTVGTKITKKEIKIQLNDEPRDVTLMIWDIMGHQGFRHILQEAYFFGAQGIIAVCDITRERTLVDLYSWMDAVSCVAGEIPVAFFGNKYDLKDDRQLELNELKSFASRYENSLAYLTSAKTGFNVELGFRTLAVKILEDVL